MQEGDKIKFYGTSWCPTSRRAKKLFIKEGIEFEWINIDEDPTARAYVIAVNNGNRSVPTIVFPDGEILVEPSNQELSKKLSQ